MTSAHKEPKTKTRHIRVPVKLDEEIERQAEEQHRSYNGQVVYLLMELTKEKRPDNENDYQ